MQPQVHLCRGHVGGLCVKFLLVDNACCFTRDRFCEKRMKVIGILVFAISMCWMTGIFIHVSINWTLNSVIQAIKRWCADSLGR